MGFWIFMTISGLLIPAIMIVFGIIFRKSAPKSINCFFGYRTKRSMKNQSSWQFAHRHFGKVWLITGLILLPVSAGWMLLLLEKTETQISMWGMILCGVQLLVLLVSLFPTEAALRKKFDR